MSNSFGFRGEAFDGGGKRTGVGPVVTFTGGSNPNTGWEASRASTLEEITWGVLRSIKSSGKMVLAVPFSVAAGNNFNFRPNTALARFTIEIFEQSRKLKSLFFMNLEIGMILPVKLENITIPVGNRSFEQRFEMLSMSEVFITINNTNIDVQ